MKSRLMLPVLAACLAVCLSWTVRAEEPPKHMEVRSAFDPGSGLFERHSGESVEEIAAGAPLADDGKYWSRSNSKIPTPKAGIEDGREFRLKIRELADRLLEADEASLRGRTIVPVSFVSVDGFDRSSSFGKLVSEQLISELNRRGLHIREYRTRNAPEPRPGAGEFMLTREPAARPALEPGVLVAAGTYYSDEDNLFINARLFDALDGMVLTAASMVMPQNPTTRTMLARGAGLRLAPAETGIKAFSDMTDKSSMGFLFNEEDLH
jgi:TolB-like protein